MRAAFVLDRYGTDAVLTSAMIQLLNAVVFAKFGAFLGCRRQ